MQVHNSAAVKSSAVDDSGKDPSSTELPAKSPGNSPTKKTPSKSSLEKKPSNSSGKMASKSATGSGSASPDNADKFAAFKARKEQGNNSP
jgi:hypothetical protein